MFIFEKDRERNTDCEWGRGREREGDRDSEAAFVLNSSIEFKVGISYYLFNQSSVNGYKTISNLLLL